MGSPVSVWDNDSPHLSSIRNALASRPTGMATPPLGSFPKGDKSFGQKIVCMQQQFSVAHFSDTSCQVVPLSPPWDEQPWRPSQAPSADASQFQPRSPNA